MLYTYGLQWIDYGGEYTHHTEEEDIAKILIQIGLNIEDMTSYGGIKTKEQHFWYIETSKELPEWNPSNRMYDLNLGGNRNRFHEGHELWMYTFPIDEDSVVAKCKPEDYCPLEGIDENLIIDLIAEAGGESIDRNKELLVDWIMEIKDEIED